MSDDNQSTIESLDDLYARAASATGSMEVDPRVVMCLIQYVERLNVVVGGHKTPPDEPTVDALYADGSFLILCDLAAGGAVTVVATAEHAKVLSKRLARERPAEGTHRWHVLDNEGCVVTPPLRSSDAGDDSQAETLDVPTAEVSGE